MDIVGARVQLIVTGIARGSGVYDSESTRSQIAQSDSDVTPTCRGVDETCGALVFLMCSAPKTRAHPRPAAGRVALAV